MKEQACKEMRSIVDSEINKGSAKSLFEVLCSVGSITSARDRSWSFARVDNREEVDCRLLEV